MKLTETCGQADKKIVVVRLISFKCGFVSYRCAAFLTSVYDDKSLFGVGKSLNRAENSAAFVGSVAGIYVNV